MATSLELDHLRTLVAIAECGGFSKAATVLHISQPALSQHVRLLEARLKRKLFVKEGRVMKFTSEGERVLAEARHILAVHDEALERLQADAQQTIVVGSTEHSAEQVLPEMLRVLSQAFPGVQTRFEIGRSTQLAESVDKGSVDLAFILNPSGQVRGYEVGRLPLRWYSAPGWTPPVDGLAWPLVAFEEPCALRERAICALSADGHRVDVAAQSTTLEGVLAGVRAGLGVALLPNAGGTPSGVRVQRGLPDTGEVPLSIVTRRGIAPQVQNAAVQAGTDFFAERPHLQLLAGGAEPERSYSVL